MTAPSAGDASDVRHAAAADARVHLEHARGLHFDAHALGREAHALSDHLLEDRDPAGALVEQRRLEAHGAVLFERYLRVVLSAARRALAAGNRAPVEPAGGRFGLRLAVAGGADSRAKRVGGAVLREHVPQRRRFAVAREIHQPELDRVDGEGFGDLVDLRLERPQPLRLARPAHVAAGRIVRVDHVLSDPGVGDAVRPASAGDAHEVPGRLVAGVGAAVEDDADVVGDDCAVPA